MGLCLIYDIALIFSLESLYKEEQIDSICEVIDLKKESEYNNKYIVKIVKKGKLKNTKFILYTNKNCNFVPGDILIFQGEFNSPEKARNYNGFNYSNYLKQRKIYGIIYANNVKKTFTKKDKYYFRGKILNSFIQNFNKIYDKTQEGFLEGILFGYTEKLEDDLKENFRLANISHVLAISGLHIYYINYMASIFFEKLIKNKRLQKYILIILLILFWFIIGESVSCTRACIMEIISIISFLFNRKYNFYRSYLISFFIIIILNPYNIFNIGMWLSYFGILGIKLFYNFLDLIFKHFLKFNKIFNEIIKVSIMSICVQIMIFPIIIYNFNTISCLFLVSNIIVFLFIDKIIILGYLSLLLSFINFNISLFFSNFNEILISMFLKIVTILNSLPLSNIYVKTPHVISILIYYFILCFVYFFSIRNKHFVLRLFCSSIFIRIQLKRLYLKIRKIPYILIIIILIFGMFQFKNEFSYLDIYFLDVGQGDCCLIKTPEGKNILIDGGEGNSEKYDYGKNVVVPYLLDRRITKLNYLIISHFDSDHVGGVISVIKELKVESIIIGKQFETNENLEYFFEIIKSKNIPIKVVEAGDKICIEKNLIFYTLWPSSENLIKENVLNNNSLVCKLIYKDFSCIFTGDIEEIAEKELVEKYKDSNILKSNILKVAHHGSKTSSTREFLEKVKPEYALIGVGKNNNFGHPSNITIEKLKEMYCTIFRTDINGEIMIKVNRKGKIIKRKTIF